MGHRNVNRSEKKIHLEKYGVTLLVTHKLHFSLASTFLCQQVRFFLIGESIKIQWLPHLFQGSDYCLGLETSWDGIFTVLASSWSWDPVSWSLDLASWSWRLLALGFALTVLVPSLHKACQHSHQRIMCTTHVSEPLANYSWHINTKKSKNSM